MPMPNLFLVVCAGCAYRAGSVRLPDPMPPSCSPRPCLRALRRKARKQSSTLWERFLRQRPDERKVHLIPLRAAVPLARARLEGPQWARIRIARDATDQAARNLPLEVGPIDVAGSYLLLLLLPHESGVLERVQITIHTEVPEKFEPTHLVTRIPAGGSLDYPIRLVHRERQAGRRMGASDLAPLVRLVGLQRRGGTGASGQEQGVAIEPISLTPGDGATATIVFRIRGELPGVYTGRTLLSLEPHYSLSLPFLVTVTN